MASKNVALADLIEKPDQTLKDARDSGPVVETELGPLVVSHAAVRAVAQSPKLRPSFSRMVTPNTEPEIKSTY